MYNDITKNNNELELKEENIYLKLIELKIDYCFLGKSCNSTDEHRKHFLISLLLR